MQQAPVAFSMIIGTNFIIQYANNKQLELWDKTEIEVFNKPLFEVFPGLRYHSFEELLTKVYREGATYTGIEVPTRLYRNSKFEDCWFSFSYEPFRNDIGDVEGIMVMSTDVTELVKERKLKLENEELKQSNQTTQTLLTHLTLATTSANVGTWLYDLKEGTLVWSALHKQMWGYDESRTSLSYEHWHKVIHADDVPRCFDELKESLEQKRLYEVEYRIVPANGAPMRWVRSVGKYYFDGNGEVINMTGVTMDITNETITRHQIEESEKRFRGTFENAAVGIAHVALDGRWLMVNDRMCRIVGYTKEELLHRNFQDLTYAEDLSIDLEYMNSLLQGHSDSYSMEKRYLHKKGDIVWVNLTVSLVRDQSENPQYFISIVENITERKKAENNLKETNERLKAALDASSTGTFIWNIQTNELSWDENLDRLFGLSSGTSVRSLHKFIETVHPADRQAVIDACAKCASEGADFEMEFRVVYPDGSIHWLFDKGKTYRDHEGIPLYMTGACVDITRQKKADEIIKENEQRFRILLDTLPQMVWVRDANGGIEYASKSWQQYSGIENMDEAWIQIVHPDDWISIMEQWEKDYTAGRSCKYEVRLRSKEGEYRWHYSIAEPIKDDKGIIVKWIGTISDIHVQKVFTEKLEKEVGERTKELHRSNQDLQQFAHVASHDLKEPVRKILFFGGKLKDEMKDHSSPAASRYIQKIENAVSRMQSMIDGVLMYSSLTEKNQQFDSVDINRMIDDIVDDLEISIHQKEARIEKTDLPIIKGYPILLHQLFYNLFNNSLKFSKPDVKPLIKISAKHLESKQMIEIVVKDNGIGFHPRYNEEIFKTFIRLYSKDHFEGTGLGLSLCKKIVERHGGTIIANSEEGNGAEFTITLPML